MNSDRQDTRKLLVDLRTSLGIDRIYRVLEQRIFFVIFRKSKARESSKNCLLDQGRVGDFSISKVLRSF